MSDDAKGFMEDALEVDELGGSQADPADEVEAEGTTFISDATTEELDLLRSELSRLQAERAELETAAEENKGRWMRARAELDNYRRRAAQDVERAREAGMDSALLSVMSVYDDLGRALKAAQDTDDPASIVPGVQSVRDSLERNLDTLGLKRVGSVGEAFDPDFHEALTAVPTENPEQAGTIADVFEVGFTKGERLVRPARVVVYQE